MKRRTFLKAVAAGGTAGAVTAAISAPAISQGKRRALERISPSDVYRPFNNMYTQVIRSSGRTQIDVAGTVSLDSERNLVGEGDMATQVRVTFENIRKSLAAAGAKPSDVVRIHIFTLDVDRFLKEAGAEMVKFFGGASPASTLAGVTRLADPRYLVEIEATAIVD